MENNDPFQEFKTRMEAAGMPPAAIDAFRHSYATLRSGDSGLIPESALQPVSSLPRLEEIPQPPQASKLLAQTAIVKLNGGLGTSMGLDQAKSLLPIKKDLTFLDFIARQTLHLRRKHQVPLRLLLMNSFSTSAGTRSFLERYPDLGAPEELELMQNAVPKVDAATLRPALWPDNPQMEWCPPGHGDLYPSLLGSNWLQRLLREGVNFLFVSNADNLGASLDLPLLASFAGSGRPFLMEAAERTAADRKGGHLAMRGSQLVLRESAQCPESDMAHFQNIERHRFFNTNNLWIRLDALADLLEKNNGFIPLPVIRNSKTIDPRNPASPKVLQLETAMGAAIECFADSAAIVAPRSRFSPVKTTSDLLALRSDAFEVTDDWRIRLTSERNEIPPAIDLDPVHYKLAGQLDRFLNGNVPSLAGCSELRIRGPFILTGETVFKGRVHLANPDSRPRPLPPGTYQDMT